ncbi:MAG: hypothetical protein RLO81_10900, partial [Fulvivirga sp.]|uniref:hypothetical protein n=1 Tax=Fulvivirga sp. TaxID=1931237 RepID=UPI0032EC2695
LLKLDYSTWEKALDDEDSYIFKCLNLMLESDKIKSLPDNLVSAYKSALTGYANGEFVFNSDEAWERLYSKVNKNKLKPTFKNIRDIFISEKKITPEQFKYLLPFLKDHAALDKRSNDVVRKILSEVATVNDCLTVIIRESDFFLPIIKSAKDDADDFKDIIRQKIENGITENGLLEFAKKLKIEFELPEE